jgi:hypothetical protein
MRHAYVGFKCKTCGTPINVTERFRYREGQEVPVIKESCERSCGICHQLHKYDPKDAQLFIEPGAGAVHDIADRLPGKKPKK